MGKRCKHIYGEGYYDLQLGARVKRTQMCKLCKKKLVTDLTKDPEAPVTRIVGMKPGGTFSA
jgi:hypothetical protein